MAEEALNLPIIGVRARGVKESGHRGAPARCVAVAGTLRYTGCKPGFRAGRSGRDW